MNNNSLTFPFTISSFIYAFCLSVLVLHFRSGLIEIINPLDLIFITSLMILVTITPHALSSLFSTKKSWYSSSETFTVLILLINCFIGHYLISGKVASIYPYFVVILASVTLVQLSYHKLKLFHFRQALILTFLFLFISILFFSSGYQSILFPEQIILGEVHRDTIFHMAITEMLTSSGIATTGLHGTASINYHWGSHYLFSGLGKAIGIDALTFYNFAYPIIFIPLIIKTILSFIQVLSIKIDLPRLSIFFFVLSTIVMLTTGILRPTFIFSESTAVATIFLLLHATMILKFGHTPELIKTPFILFSVFIFIVILFSKISTFFVYVPVVLYCFIRYDRSFRSLVYSFFILIITGVLAYLFVYPFEVATGPVDEVSLMEWVQIILIRMQTFWSGPVTPLVQLFPLLIAVVFYFKRTALLSDLKYNKLILLELLLLMNLLSILPAFLLTLKPIDIYYFIYLHILLTISYLLLIVHSRLLLFKHLKKLLITFFLILVLFPFSTISGAYTLYFDDRGIRPVNMQFMNLTAEQKLMSELVSELFQIRNTNCDGTSAVFIPGDQDWYYYSQQFRPHSSYFVVPALSGCAMIGGLTESALDKGLINYSFEYFTSHPDLPIKDLNSAQDAAIRFGFTQLIVFEKEGNHLKRTIISLS